MVRPILSCKDPYTAAEAFTSAGWHIDFSQPPESGDPLVSVSLEDNAVLLGVTEGYVSAEQSPHLGCGVVFYLTVPKGRIHEIHQNHQMLCPTALMPQPWGDLAFEVTIAGYHFMIAAK